ncbi:MAG TPA: hypothetical protein VFR31_20010 [Thermoanaerobaculia bacterium]|nr:hypothetical protein [Thermoanaerobaculia bacterium]
MADNTVDIVQQIDDLQVMVRFVSEPGRLRAAVSIPNGTGEKDIDPGDVSLEVWHKGEALQRVEGAEPRRVETHTRGVTVHFLYELEPPMGAQLGASAEPFECTVTFRGRARTFEVSL